MEAPQVISYASPQMVRPRITFRGALTTLIVGGGLLLFTLALIGIAWSIFHHVAQGPRTRSMDSLETLGGIVAGLACASFVAGMVIIVMGLRGVRQRETV